MDYEKLFLVADWHLGEDRFTIMQRPFDEVGQMEELIRKEHNKVVSSEDFVIVNGDAIYKGAKDPDRWLRFIKSLNGHKALIRGNHDVPYTDEFFSDAFESVVKDGGGIEFEYKGTPLYVTHYPTQGREDCFNLIGHIHGAWKYQKNMFNVGVDTNFFKPVHISQIPFFMKAIEEFYDDDVWCADNPINSRYNNRGKKGRYFKG